MRALTTMSLFAEHEKCDLFVGSRFLLAIQRSLRHQAANSPSHTTYLILLGHLSKRDVYYRLRESDKTLATEQG